MKEKAINKTDKKTMLKKIITSLLLIFSLAGSVGAYLYFKPAKNYRDSKPDITMPAEQLISNYADGEEQANAKYLNKVIEVHGMVNDISLDEKGITSINLNSGTGMVMVSCSMDSNATDDYTKIAKGDLVKIKGLCSGMLMDVVLVKCVLVK
jgi:hypothetical protein